VLAGCEQTDDELVRRVAGKDTLALKVLFVRYHDNVFKYIFRLLRDEAVAEEIANEVFLKLWQGAATFEGRSAVWPWLLAVARTSALRYARKRRDVALEDGVAETLVDQADTPSESMLKSDKARLLQSCIDNLSRQHREIIELVYFHEKTVKEVAAILDIPGNTVKTRMFYARKRLSEIARRQGLERGWP